MATLEKIRNRAGCLVIAIGGALIAFLFGDIIKGGSSIMQDREMNAFTVNGKATKIQEYEDKVNQVMEMYKSQGMATLDDSQTNQVRNQVFQGMVAEQVLLSEADKLGITVSPAETFDLIQGENISPVISQNPMFANPESGSFDKLALLNFLKQINSKADYTPEEQSQINQYKNMWVDIEKNVRKQKLNDKYVNLLAGAILANKLEVEYAMKGDNSIADILYVQQGVNSATNIEVTPTDADLKKYYDEHKDYFKTIDKSAMVDVIYANIVPSKSDIENAKSDIETAHNDLSSGQSPALVLDEFSDTPFMDMYLPLSEFNSQVFSADFLAFLSGASVGEVSKVMDEGDKFTVAKLVGVKNTPESLKVRHIVLAPAGSFEGQVNGDSLLTALKANPSSFAQAATAYSLDRNSSSKGGEIGWLNEAMATNFISAKFSDAIYSAKIGEPFVFTSKYGEHIILVEEAKAPIAKYNVAIAQRTVVPSSETQGLLYNEVSTFLNEHKSGDIAAEALNAGYQVMENVRVMASQPMISQNIDNSRKVVRWVMNAKKNEVSEINECGSKYVIARVNKLIPAGIIPFEDVKEQITPIVEEQLKVDAMFDKLVAAGYSSLNDFAAAVDQPIDTLNSVTYSSSRLANIGYEPAINAVAKNAPLNKVMPVKGDRAVYLINVTNRSEGSTPMNEEEMKMMVNNARSGAIRSQAINQIIVKSKIEDNRSKFQ